MGLLFSQPAAQPQQAIEASGAKSPSPLKHPQVGAFVGRIVAVWRSGEMDRIAQFADRLVSTNPAIHAVEVNWDGSGNVRVLWSNEQGSHTLAGPLSDLGQWIYERKDALPVPPSVVEHPVFEIPSHLTEEAIRMLETWDLEITGEETGPGADQKPSKGQLLARTPWGF